MSDQKLIRVAFVRFSPNGKAYPARCDRVDILCGHEVEVLMRAQSDNAYYMDGVVERVESHRWHCTCQVANLLSEVEYSISDDGHFHRKVNRASAKVYTISDWNERKSRYHESLPLSARDEMREIYEAAAGNDGEVAYLNDGMWITPDGDLDDRGR